MQNFVRKYCRIFNFVPEKRKLSHTVCVIWRCQVLDDFYGIWREWMNGQLADIALLFSMTRGRVEELIRQSAPRVMSRQRGRHASSTRRIATRTSYVVYVRRRRLQRDAADPSIYQNEQSSRSPHSLSHWGLQMRMLKQVDIIHRTEDQGCCLSFDRIGSLVRRISTAQTTQYDSYKHR